VSKACPQENDGVCCKGQAGQAGQAKMRVEVCGGGRAARKRCNMSDFTHRLNSISIEEIITKYCGDKVELLDEGQYKKINPCPKCGHNDCCKINTDNNTLVCWGEEKKYLTPIKAIQWLDDLEESEAIIKLVEDFHVMIPEDFKEAYAEYLKQIRKQGLLRRFAEECHKLMAPDDYQYWTGQRGLTEEMIKEKLIGLCPGDGRIFNQLLSEGYTKEELEESKLFYSTEKEYFAIWHVDRLYPYYTLPNWYKGAIIDIQGRVCTSDFKALKLPKYKNLSGQVEQLYNPAALDIYTLDKLIDNIVFLAEGIPDVLSLIQMGFNATGSYGVGAVKDKWLDRFKARKNVYIIFDSDDAGRNGAADLARKIGEPAKIINLPEVKDVNELLVKYGTETGREIIEGLMKEAKTALEISIHSLPGEFWQVDDREIKDISLIILDLPPHRQVHYKQLLQKHFSCTKENIENTIRYYKGERSNEVEINSSPGGNPKEEKEVFKPDPALVRLGQCFVLNKVFYAQEFIVDVDKGKYQKTDVRIISSDRKVLLPPTPVSKDSKEIISWQVDKDQLQLRRPLMNAASRWSKSGTPYSINYFIEGKVTGVNSAKLYQRIRSMFQRYFYTPEKYDYDILTLFTMFTYYFELYDAVPYIYLYGPPESGKTTVSILLQNLAFNGDLVSNISTAALFRECEQKQPVLILDEQENIANSKANEEKGDYMSIIKDGYKRTGTIKRQNPNDCSITEEFQVFNPLVIANTKGLESIIKSRVIQITTRPAPKGNISGTIPLKPSNPEFIRETQLIRDALYCWVMLNHSYLRELPNFNVGEVVSNRAEELFQPLIALANLIELSDTSKELQIVSELINCLPSKQMKRSSHRTKDPVEQLREACLLALADENVKERGQALWVPNIALLDKLVEVNGQYQSYMTTSWIGEKITSSGWILEDNDKRRSNLRTVKRDPKTNLPLNTVNNEEEEKKRQFYYLRYDLLKGETVDVSRATTSSL